MDNMQNNFTPRVVTILEDAAKKVKDEGGTLLYPEQVLLEILNFKRGSAYRILTTNCDSGVLYEVISSINKKDESVCSDKVLMSKELEKAVGIAKDISKELDNGYIGMEHLLLGIFNDTKTQLYKLLIDSNLQIDKVKAELRKEIDLTQEDNEVLEPAGHTEETPQTITLEKFGVNLIEKARSGELQPVIGRGKEINRAIRSLCRKNKNCPVLVGDAGVGKTAIVHAIAQHIVAGSVPNRLSDKIIFELDMALLIAGTKYRGQFEERIKKVLEEVAANPNVIVFLDEIHTIIGAGSAEGTMDASNILKPALARGEFPCIGATTHNEYRKYIEKDGALERRFQKVDISEPTEKEALLMLQGAKGYYEQFHKVVLNDDILKMACELSTKFISNRFLPDKAFDVIDEASVLSSISNKKSKIKTKEEIELIKIKNEKQGLLNKQRYEQINALKEREEELKKKVSCLEEEDVLFSEVSKENVYEVISDMSKIPIENIRFSSSLHLKQMKSLLKSGIIGQDNAVENICKSLAKSKTPLKDSSRPIGSFLFLGATGVGKTLLAKNIAFTLFGDKKSLVRFDMSEYQTKESVNKLIGGSPSYVGYEEGGQLVNAVRNNPHSVVLFDEIEKAHSEVIQILLQIMEDGNLTDNMGKKADFTNSIIVMTSNVGGQVDVSKPKTGLGFGSKEEFSDYDQEVRKACENYFAPEFINRLSKVVIFNKIERDYILPIVKVESNKLKDRLKKQGVDISFSNKVLENIASKGFSDKYGAREVRRILENEIENLLIDDFIKGKIKKGNKISFRIKKDQIFYLLSQK
jgi:ATP-dependent Clp protease ATP-binding subunit ClpC